MKKVTTLAASVVLACVGSSAHASIVDMFDDPAFPVAQTARDYTNADGGVFNEYDGTPAPVGSILGGSRDLIADAQSGASGVPGVGNASTMEVFNGQLDFRNDPGVAGIGTVQWDGDDNSADLSYLLDADLVFQPGCPETGCTDFTVAVLQSDFGFEFQLGLYTDAGNFSVLTTTSQGVPTGSPELVDFPFLAWLLPTGDYLSTEGIPFSIVNVGAGPALTNIGAIELVLNSDGGQIAVDISMDSFEKRGVPEPSVLALMGIGVVAGGIATRRRRQKKA